MRKEMSGRLLITLVLFFCAQCIQAQSVISGVVTDAKSQPVSNVTVHLLNTQLAAITDAKGLFSITGQPAGRYTIELSAIGYATLAREITVTAGNTQPLQFQLQTSQLQLETVVVTAGKREELLQHIPVSVTALSASQVNAYRLWNIKELSGIVPNLYAGNPGDERNVSSVRGITTTSYDPSVTTYVDGVNQFSLDTYIPQLADIERIEVLRGPQGTLYGRNAMGGVINIITKKPGNTANGFAEITAGNYNQQRYTAGVRFPLVKDKLFAGIAGVFSKRNGFYENAFNNTSFDKQQQLTGNYYLRYLPDERWGITLNVKHQNNRNNGAFPVTGSLDEALNNPFVLSQNAVGKMIDNTFNASLAVNHKGKTADIAWQTAWQNNHRYYNAPIDGDFSPLDAVTVINDFGRHWNNVKVLTSELRISSAANKTSRFGWTAGAYFFQQCNPNKQVTHFGKDAAIVGAPTTDFSTINTTTGKNTGGALFGQISYQLTTRLSLVAGARFDYENKRLQALGEYQPDGQPAFETRTDTAASVHFNAVSPKLALQYAFTPEHNLYAGYSRGYRTGGLTQLSGDPSQPPLYPYQPEYSNNIELGTKNSFAGNRLRVNAVLFLTYLNNAQVPVLVLPDAITVTKNTGKLVSKGAELEVSANPLKGLQVDYNFGYTDAKYKSFGISSGGQVVDLAGKKQVFTPGFTSALAAQYNYTLSETKHIQLIGRGEWFSFGERYFDFANSIRQPAYGLLNAKLGISNQSVAIYAWMRNITNKKYIEYAYDFGAVHLANPRTFGATVAVMF